MKAEEIFLVAVEKKTPCERAAYLEGACGDAPALRAQVAALLRSHEQAGSFLEQPLFVSSPTSDTFVVAENPAHTSARTSCCKKSAKAAWARFTWPSSKNPSAAWLP